MGLKNMLFRNLGRVSVGIVLVVLTAGWGSVGHRIINSNVVVHLPHEMLGFVQQVKFLTDHASDADNRKNGDNQKPYLLREGPRHFIDVDEFPEFTTKSVPQNLSTLIARSDSATVFTIGVNPWATLWTMDSLAAQLRRHDWVKVWQSAADLGHYIGDAHQPLHNTKDYDGRSTISGSNGIHSRYESGMISAFQSSLTIQPDSAHYIASPIGFIFDIVYVSNSFVDSIYDADIYARQISGYSGSGTIPAGYYTALWQKTGAWTQRQIQLATEHFASLLYTAWVNAGSPAIPTAVRDLANYILPSTIWLGPNYPNPFNPSTTILFKIPEKAHVTLAVYTLHGNQVALLMDRTVEAGTYENTFDADGLSLSSGLYFYRLQVHSGACTTTLTKKMLLLK